MFSFSEISRWLSFKLDPISLEDWIANREYLGPMENPQDLDLELENAYQIEELRHKKESPKKPLSTFTLISGQELSGSVHVSEGVWLIAPVGVVLRNEPKILEVEISGAMKDKFFMGSREIKVLSLEPSSKYQVKIRTKGNLKIDKKNDLKLAIEGIKQLIIDTRGRPITFDDALTQREKMIEWKKIV